MHPWIVQKLAEQRVEDRRQEADAARLRQAARRATADKRHSSPHSTPSNDQSIAADAHPSLVHEQEVSNGSRSTVKDAIAMTAKYAVRDLPRQGVHHGDRAMIDVRELRKNYGGRTVVNGVSFSVDEGEIFGILGPNGAGKTTTVECIGGLRRPDGGSISLAGMDVTDEGIALREALGIQLQESRLPDKQTVAEALGLYSSFYPHPRDWHELVERLGLHGTEKTYFGQLSGGQKQRLSVALALVGNPRVAILDELTTGLDPAARREVWSLLEDLRGTGVTLLLVSHFMEEAERLCDRVVVIDHGKVVAEDTPDGLAASVAADQRMSFVPSQPIDAAGLNALPDVHTATLNGGRVVVTGTDTVATTVITALHERGITATKLRVDQPSLDDAFIALTRTDGACRAGAAGHHDPTNEYHEVPA